MCYSKQFKRGCLHSIWLCKMSTNRKKSVSFLKRILRPFIINYSFIIKMTTKNPIRVAGIIYMIIFVLNFRSSSTFVFCFLKVERPWMLIMLSQYIVLSGICFPCIFCMLCPTKPFYCFFFFQKVKNIPHNFLANEQLKCSIVNEKIALVMSNDEKVLILIDLIIPLNF